MINIIIAGAVAYLLGSVSFAILIPRFLGTTKDVRKEGSGNAGATNVLRTQGKLLGAVVLLADLLKGVLAAWIGLAIAGPEGGGVAGVCAMLGHCYPVFFGFKGGKGVATGAGIVLILMPKTFLVSLVLFTIVCIVSKMVSLGSLTAALSIYVSLFLFKPPLPIVIFGLFAPALLVWSHRTNIQRLLRGEESKIGQRS
jgi:glycerol-3-phosphate acyltransferase PlsY